MKNLISTTMFTLVSVFAFSQEYKFDVKSYDLYNISGYAEKDVILENVKDFVPNVTNRSYVVDLGKKVTLFYENNALVEKLEIEDVIQTNDGIEVVVNSYLTQKDLVTTFSIYLTLQNNEVSHVAFFWYDPFNNLTVVKNVTNTKESK
jgi:flagellar assembly factor FliW